MHFHVSRELTRPWAAKHYTPVGEFPDWSITGLRLTPDGRGAHSIYVRAESPEHAIAIAEAVVTAIDSAVRNTPAPKPVLIPVRDLVLDARDARILVTSFAEIGGSLEFTDDGAVVTGMSEDDARLLISALFESVSTWHRVCLEVKARVAKGLLGFCVLPDIRVR